jgi:hypothetical protein
VGHGLLDLLIKVIYPADEPLVFGIDETIERRWREKIAARGIYRDPVRSSDSHFVKASGLRWISLSIPPYLRNETDFCRNREKIYTPTSRSNSTPNATERNRSDFLGCIALSSRSLCRLFPLHDRNPVFSPCVGIVSFFRGYAGISKGIR